jgi:hypothetical protein
MMIHTSFVIVRLFSHNISVIFNTLLPTLSKTLHTSVAKFPTSTSEHFMMTLFQFVVVCKVTSTPCILQRLKQVVGGCQIWAVSRMGKSCPTYFCDCFTCAQTGVRAGIVVKEKDEFLVSVKTNCTDALSQFVESFLAALVMSSEAETGNFTTLVYSVLRNSGKS